MVSLVACFSQVPAARWRRLSVGVFFGLLLLLGGWLHRDYGVSWDEPTDHQNGAVSGRYVAEQLLPGLLQNHPTLATIPPLAGYPDNDHGVLFELPVAALGMLLTPGNPQGYFFLRHLLIFLTFVGGVCVLYQLGRHCYAPDWRWALLGAALLVLSPRLFAEAFFNGKDIPFMVCFALAMLTLLRLLARPTAGRVLLHALATAAAIAIRVPGILLLAFTLGMVLLELVWPTTDGPGRPARRWLPLLALYLAATAALTVLAWPALWENPAGNFLRAYRSLSHFNWIATVFYLGRYLHGYALPWHYIPVWLTVTTPVPYLLAALLGLAGAGRQLWQSGGARLRTQAGRLDVLLAGWLLGPIIVVIVLHSTLYDGWRHLYFVYPALLLWAVRGLQEVGRAVWARRPAWRLGAVALVLSGAELLHVTYQMVRLHPHQHMYFSVLPGPVAERLLERDYWGLSFRKGLEWILAHDSSPELTIHASSQYPLYNNLLVLPPQDRARFRHLKSNAARYYITNYRWHEPSYLDSVGTEVYSLHAGGVKILSVFRNQ